MIKQIIEGMKGIVLIDFLFGVQIGLFIAAIIIMIKL